MEVTLMGPDDEGRWHLADCNGIDFCIVQKPDDHPYAAKLFGWVPCDECEADGTADCAHKSSDEMIEEAREFLTEHTGEEITAPRHIAEYFEECE